MRQYLLSKTITDERALRAPTPLCTVEDSSQNAFRLATFEAINWPIFTCLGLWSARKMKYNSNYNQEIPPIHELIT